MVEKEITRPLERKIKGMKGLKQMFSASQDNVSIIAVSFKAEMTLNETMLALQRKVGSAQGDIPKTAHRSKVEETSISDIPIGMIALFGDAPPRTLEEQGKKIRDSIKKIAGIKRVVLPGERKQYVSVKLIPDRLRMLGISSLDIRNSIVAYNHDAPWGKFNNDQLTFSMNMSGNFKSIKDVEELPLLRLDKKGLIRVKDVATVEKRLFRERVKASLSWEQEDYVSVTAINIHKSAGKDTIALMRQVREKIGAFQSSPDWDSRITVKIVGDQSIVIWDELYRGFKNAWQSMLAVFIVLFVMLTWREALIAAVSVPLTLLGTLAVLWALGYTFNLLVIVGMILALGLLVDDFILIMEGMHEGIFVLQLGFVKSVKRTISLYAVPSFSGSTTTILVFIPLIFIGGIEGKFVRIIPVTAAICLVVSYIVSLIIGPPISRMVLVSKKKKFEPDKIDKIAEKAGRTLSDWLKKHVISSRKKALVWIAFAVVLFVFSLGATDLLRNTLYPKEDGRGMGITVQFPPQTQLEESEKLVEEVAKILRSKPYFEYVFQIVGEKDSYSLGSFHDMLMPQLSSNTVGFSCFLVKRSEREQLAHLYVEPLREELKAVLDHLPGVNIIMSPQIGGPSSEDPIQIDIVGPDLKKLKEISLQVQKALKKVPGVVDVRDNLGPVNFSLGMRPIREAMDFYGVSQQELDYQMIALMENEKIGTFKLENADDDLDIRLESEWPGQKKNHIGPENWESLANLSILNSKGTPIPLWSLVEPRLVESPQVIVHKDGFRSITVRSKTSTAYAPEVIRAMRPVMNEMQKDWPQEFSFEFAGEEEVDNTYLKMFRIFLVSMLLVYCLLALLFDSMLQPIMILSTVLFALIGVILGFFLADIPFSFSASIGIVALVGIVVNDAIILVDTMNSYLKKGHTSFESAMHGAADRLRPIASTTITNFAGLMPLALSDPGWSPLCWAVIFGELTATFGAVILMPALYVILTPKFKKTISADLEADLQTT
jgi:multidrug efflux pump subunit AcrB